MHSPFPTFTRKLSFDEQRLLSPQQAEAYCDWVMGLPLRAIKQKVSGESYLQRDYDKSEGSWMNYETAE
jgi:hypothetical protein